MSQLKDAWAVIRPGADERHGPLPPLLLMLTFVTGLVDAFSYLMLGHVLVANMTGNVVFLGFAVAGAPGFIWWASVLAVITFLVGALVGGRLIGHARSHRGRQLLASSAVEVVLLALAWVISLVIHQPYRGPWLAALVLVLGIALGLQNATARSLGVPDLTTTVLTLTITGIASDSRAAGGTGSKLGRRSMPIVTMFLGALVGALLTVRGHGSIDLGVATVVVLAVLMFAARHRRSADPWATHGR